MNSARQATSLRDHRLRTNAGLALILALAACGSGIGLERSWTNGRGEAVGSDLIRSVQGPADHCGWSSAGFLFIGRGGNLDGVPAEFNDQYVRDPEGLFDGRLDADFEADLTLPADAMATGYTNGTLDLWLSQQDDGAVYVKVADTFERWPRVSGDDPILCA